MRNSAPIIIFVALAALQLPLGAQKKVTYVDDVRPLLQRYCGNCHNTDRKRADLDVTSYNTLMAGSSSGEVVQSGDAGDSTLYLLVSHQLEPYMPPRQPRMPEKNLAILKAWIEGGLLETSGSKARAAKKSGVNLALSAPVTGKPDGPPPMPGDVLLDPVIVTERPGTINALAHSPWAPLVAIAGQKQVVLYDTSTLKLRGILPFPEGDPKSIRFSRNGRFLLVGGGKDASLGLAALYDITTGRRVTRVGAEPDAVLTADITSDQTLIAMGGPDRLVKVFSIATGEKIYQIKKHTDWVTAVGFSADSVLMATGDRGGNLRVWEAQDGARFYDLRGHRGAITSVAFRADSNVLASASMDGTVKLWDMHTGKQIRSFSAHGGGVHDVQFAMNGDMATAGRDGRVKTWDPNGRTKRQFDAFGEAALAAAFDHEGKRVIGADWSGAVRVWNAEDGKKLGDLNSNPEPLTTRIDRLTELVSGPDLPARVAALRDATAASAKASASELAPIKQRKQDLDATVAARTELVKQLTKALEESRKIVADAKVRLPKVKAQITKLDANVTAKDKARGDAEAAAKTAAKGLAARRDLVNAQKQAAAAAKSLAAQARTDQDLGRAAKLAQEALEAIERAAATAQAAHGAAVAKRDAARAAASATRAARDGKHAEVAKLEKAIKEGDKVVAKSVPAREKARADFIAAKAESKAIAAPLAALEKVAATVQRQADEAARLADEVGSIGTRLKRLRAAQVFTRLYYTRDELNAASLLVQRREIDLADTRAARVESEKALLESEEALQAARQDLATATHGATMADGTLATAQATVSDATRAMKTRTASHKAALAQVADAKRALEMSEEQIVEADRQVAALAAARDQDKQAIAQRQVDVNAAQRALHFHDAEVVRALEAVREQDATARAVRRSVTAIDDADAATRRTIEEYTGAIVRAKATLKDLDGRWETATQARVALDATQQAAKEARSGSELALAERREAHATATTERQRLRDVFDRKIADRSDIDQDLRDVAGKLSEARNRDDKQRVRELARQVGSLTGRSLRLALDGTQAKIRLRDADLTLTTLTKELQSLGAARQAADAEATASQANRPRLTTEISELEAKRAVAAAEVERLAALPKPTDHGHAERQRRRAALQERVRVAVAERDTRRAVARQLSSDRAAPREALAAAEVGLGLAREALAHRIAKRDRAVATATAKKSSHAALTEAIGSAERSAAEAASHVAEAQKSLATVGAAANAATAARDAAHGAVANAKKVADAAPDAVTEKATTTQAAREAVRGAEGLLDEAQAKRADLEARLSQLEAAYSKARN